MTDFLDESALGLQGAGAQSASIPSLFLSHGAPTLPLTDTAVRRFLLGLGAQLPRPRAILVASAHWETAAPMVSAVATNETIYDFRGFPRELYQMQYPAPGAPDVAAEVVALLQAAGLSCGIDHARGLDHGAWVPLMLIYPEADIPVLQLSVQPHLGPAHHLRVGAAVAALREQGVLIVGSGSLTHDLSEFRGQALDAPVPDWVTEFADWVDAALIGGRLDDLLEYRRRAPFAVKNHPTEEHLLPLFVALGASGAGGVAWRLHASANFGILRMDGYSFSSASADVAKGTLVASLV